MHIGDKLRAGPEKYLLHLGSSYVVERSLEFSQQGWDAKKS